MRWGTFLSSPVAGSKHVPWLALIVSVFVGTSAYFVFAQTWPEPEPRAKFSLGSTQSINSFYPSPIKFSPSPIKFSHNGRWLAAIYRVLGPELQLLDILSGKVVFKHDATTCCFSPVEDRLAFDYRNRIHLVDICDGMRLTSLPSLPDGEYCVTFCFDKTGHLRVASSEKRRLLMRTVRLATGPTEWSEPKVTGHSIGMNATVSNECAFAHKGPSVSLSRAYDHRRNPVQAFDPAKVEMITEFPAPDGFEDAAVTPDGKVLVVLADDGVEIRQTRSGERRRLHLPARSHPVLSPDGRFLVARTQVEPWSMVADQPSWARRMLMHVGLAEVPGALDELRLFDLVHGTEVFTFGRGQIAGFSPDGKTLAVGCGDGTIELWDMPIRKPYGLIGLLATLTGLMTVTVLQAYSAWRRRKQHRLGCTTSTL